MTPTRNERQDVAERLGLLMIDASFPPRWEGRRGGLEVAVECRRVDRPTHELDRDWMWMAAIGHPKIPKTIIMERRNPANGPGTTAEGLTGDPLFDQQVAIKAGFSDALPGLDLPTRVRLQELLSFELSAWRGGVLTVWQPGTSFTEEPAALGAMLNEAIWVVGRWVHLERIEGLLHLCRGDPVLAVRIEAAAQLARLAPQRLPEVRRAVDGLLDDRLTNPERSGQLPELLALPVMQQRITTRLGGRRNAVLDHLVSALNRNPQLLASLPEMAWIRILERLPEHRVELLHLLGAQAQSVEALQAVSIYTEGLFWGRAIKAAAKAAQRAIEPRVKAGVGSLSVVEARGGGLSLADVGELSIPDEDP